MCWDGLSRWLRASMDEWAWATSKPVLGLGFSKRASSLKLRTARCRLGPFLMYRVLIQRRRYDDLLGEPDGMGGGTLYTTLTYPPGQRGCSVYRGRTSTIARKDSISSAEQPSREYGTQISEPESSDLNPPLTSDAWEILQLLDAALAVCRIRGFPVPQ
jgi:hypothetical protein